jgi:hypothetical protein
MTLKRSEPGVVSRSNARWPSSSAIVVIQPLGSSAPRDRRSSERAKSVSLQAYEPVMVAYLPSTAT